MRPDSTRPPKLSAVIACYRDGPAIPDMHERLTRTFESLGVEYEIIFVNDASPDDAREILDSLAAADNHVVAIHHSRNFGSQSAFTSGMRVASGIVRSVASLRTNRNVSGISRAASTSVDSSGRLR